MRFTMICAAALALAPLAAQAGDDDAGRNLAASCAMCHGTEGRSVGGYEPLAGMARADLVRKMVGFRSGTTPATVMHQIAKGYSERQIELIAEYFSAQRR
jgi:sulfide dehydrogenase cytochrome subunit